MCIERERRNTDLGVELQCGRCKEFWPEDKEFFFVSKGRIHSWCKACYRADQHVIEKDERWKAKHRKNPAPKPPARDWVAPLTQAVGAMASMAIEEETA